MRDGDFEAQFHSFLGEDDSVENGADELLALFEGHGVQAAVDLLSELVDSFLEVDFGAASVLIVQVGLVKFGDTFGQGVLSCLQLGECDCAGLVGIDQSAVLGS